MNNWIIRSWNKVVKPEDSVIIMGNIGSGKLEEMKEVISQLNGEKTATSRHLNDKFTKKEWREIGFKHFWGVSMFHTYPDGREVLYVIKKVEAQSDYAKTYALLVTDSENPFDGLYNGIMLSADAAKWSYNPLNTDELIDTLERLKEWDAMEDGKETRSEIKEEGEE